ncbi:MAG: type IV secretion system DNA-binding domain-containing protein [bacterium]
MDLEKITYFGETDSRGKRVKFGIKAKDRTKHIYVIGKTGMGKSTLLENMAIQDIQNGEGMAFLDPHGKTAELLLNYIPPERMNDIVYFAPFDVENPVSFNVLEDIGIDKRHLVVAGLMSTFKKIWVDAWSARMEYILTNALLALIEYPDATLLGVNRMLSEKDYRKKIVDNVKDVSVKSFWLDEFAKYTEKMAAEAIPAIQNKIGQFTANPLIRNIVGQPKSSFDIRQLMDERKILIINLSKGRVGEANANLLGSMMITKIYLAAMSRADVSEKNLKNLPNFYLYVDEFQSFANESFADILSEARKYKLNLTIAHQYIEQMSEEVRAAVFGNVGTMISFRVGAYDAEVLEKEFAPQFTAEDLVNLGMFQMYLKLMIDGVGSIPFSASSLPPFLEPIISYKSEIINSSRKNFSKTKTEVEEIIKKWFDEGKILYKSAIIPKTAINSLNNFNNSNNSNNFNNSSDKKSYQTFSPINKTYEKKEAGKFNQEKILQINKEKTPQNFTEKFEIKKVYEEKLSPSIVEIKKEEPIISAVPKFKKKEEPITSVVQEFKKKEEIKFEKNFPSMEEDLDDDFLPLKELAKKLIVENKKEEVQNQFYKKDVFANKTEQNDLTKNINQTKIMSAKNLSDLRSALDNIIKKNDIESQKSVSDNIPKIEIGIKKEELKTELKEEIKEKSEVQIKEIPEEDLKKVLGI